MNISVLSFTTNETHLLCFHDISYLLLVTANSSELSLRTKMQAVIFLCPRFNKSNLLVSSKAKIMPLTCCSDNNQEDTCNYVLSLQSYNMLSHEHGIMCSHLSLKHRTWTCDIREIAKCLQSSEIWQKTVMWHSAAKYQGNIKRTNEDLSALNKILVCVWGKCGQYNLLQLDID